MLHNSRSLARASWSMSSQHGLLSAVGLLGLAVLVPMSSPAAALADVAGTVQPAPSVPSNVLDQADRAMMDGQLVAAKSMLLRAMRTQSGFADQQRAADLLDAVNRRLRAMDEREIGVQEAEWALRTGDLRRAEMHAAGALRMSGLSDQQQARAKAVSASVTAERATMAPKLPGLITAAGEDLKAQRFPQAKATLLTLQRSGLEMDPAQRLTVDEMLVRIIDAERAAGRVFDVNEVNASILQPGTVRRAGDPAPAPAPAPATPAEAPAPPPPVVAEAAPAPAPAPAAPPVPDATADLVRQARAAEAQALMTDADSSYDAGRYSEAVRKYEDALRLREHLAADRASHAERRLADLRLRMQAAGGGGGQIGQNLISQQNALREQTRAMFDNYLEQANKSLAAGDIAKARQDLANASVTVDNAQQVFPAADIEAFRNRTKTVEAAVAAREEAIAKSRSSTEETARQQDAKERRERVAKERADRINTLLRSARDKQLERRYAEGLQDIDQILMIDPYNPAAQALKETISMNLAFLRQDERQRDRDNRVRKLREDTVEYQRPPTWPMEYPENWDRKTAERLGMGGVMESPENRRTLAVLEKKLPAQFAGAPLGNVVAYLRQNTGADVAVNWDSLRSIGVDQKTPVDLELTDKPARVVLERVLASVSRDQHSRADWTVSDGIITVASADAIQRATTTLVYNVTDLLLTVPNFTDVPRVDLEAIYSGKDNRTLATSPFNRDKREGQKVPTSRDKLDEIIQIVQRTVDPEAWRDNGDGVGSIQQLNGSLIITTTPRNHSQISSLLAKLREIRSMQINVEARFLTVATDFFEQIGFNLSLVFNTNSAMFQAAQFFDPSVRPNDLFDLSSVSNPVRRVLDSANYSPGGQAGPYPNINPFQPPIVPGPPPPGSIGGPTIVPPGTAGSRVIQNTYNGSGNRALNTLGLFNGQSMSPIPAAGGSLALAQSLFPSDGFAGGILSRAPALGITGQFLDDVQIDFLIKATQADRRTTTVTAPRLTLTNGQVANVYVVTQRSLVTDLTPVTGDGAVGFDPTVTPIPSGVTMLVEAVITADRRYVTMNIDTSINTLDRVDQSEITAVVGGALVNSGSVGSFIQLPVVTTTRVQTTVTVPDEGTVLLGGQRLLTERQVEVGVPILSKLPIINRFFTNRIESKEESTLIVLVKPTIMIQQEAEEKAFPGIMDTVKAGLGN